MTTQPPLPNKWTQFLKDVFSRGQPPMGTVDIKEIEEKAREVMTDNLPAFLFTFGGAGTCSTEAANRRAFENWRFVPRMLVDATNRNIETTIFGVKYPSPLFIAPVGGQGSLHADAELATASAAANVGVPFIMSSASSRSIEDVAAANSPDGYRWFQLYCPRTPEITLSILRRAKASGFTALVITVDAMSISWHPHSIKTGFRPFVYGVGIQVGTSDPVFMKRFDLEPRKAERTPFPLEHNKIRDAAQQGDEHALRTIQLSREWNHELGFGTFRTWEDLKFVKDNWDGPIVLKGIQQVSDAERAITEGFDGIIVSNHGGRQLDGVIASLDALDQIMCSPKVRAAQQSGKLTILFDSGIRTGSDVIKALAIGAQGVLIGRPCMYGLAIAGQEGVEQILRQTIYELHISMGLIGYSNVSDVIGKGEEILKRVVYKL